MNLSENLLIDVVKYGLTYKLLDVVQIGRFVQTGNRYIDNGLEAVVVDQANNLVFELAQKFNVPIISRSSTGRAPELGDWKGMAECAVSDAMAMTVMQWSGLAEAVAGPQSMRQSTNPLSQLMGYIRVGAMFVIMKYISYMIKQQYYNVRGLVKGGSIDYYTAGSKRILY